MFCCSPAFPMPRRRWRNDAFEPPTPTKTGTAVRDARKFGPAAPQIASGGITDPPVRWDEDCLTLNVQTPSLEDADRPVLVWIHGGGYRNGQGAVPWYNGARFAANGDIVAVSINYRLGALGFTDISRFGGEFASSGINGILDQITALEWVRDNIGNFGGDPAKVTIAGESAGGVQRRYPTRFATGSGPFQGCDCAKRCRASLPPEESG